MVKLLHMSSFSWRPQLIYIWILFLAVKLLSCDVPLVIILFVVAIVLVVLLLASISVYLLHTLNIAFTVREWAPLIHLILTATQISVGGYLPSVSDTHKMLMQTLESGGTDFPFTLWLTTYSSAVCHWPCNSQCWFNLDTIFHRIRIFFGQYVLLDPWWVSTHRIGMTLCSMSSPHLLRVENGNQCLGRTLLQEEQLQH